mgnify:FL=1
MTPTCPFCSPSDSEIVLQNELWYARWDRYPVSRGHLLLVPFRHEPNFLTLALDEQKVALDLLAQALLRLHSDFHPAGYNIGLNIGQAAGQTVAHAHIHVIPRYTGDVPDPRGGVRFVIPAKGRYWPAPSGHKADT